MKHILSVLFLLSSILSASAGIVIKGSNGVAVDFAAVFSATPQGLVVQVLETSPVITVPWSSVDLNDIKTNQPKVAAAYKTCVEEAREVPIRLGLAAKVATPSLLRLTIKESLRDPVDRTAVRTSTSSFAQMTPTGLVRTQVSTTAAATLRSDSPLLLLRAFRDANSDSQRKQSLTDLRTAGSLTVAAALDKIEADAGSLLPNNLAPRSTEDHRLVQDTEKFTKLLRDLARPGYTSNDQDRRQVAQYLQALGL